MTLESDPQDTAGQEPVERDPVRDDRRYREGMAHLQAGEWQEAIRCFEELQSAQGDNPTIRQALDQAKFKAALDAKTRVRARQSTFRWRPLLVRGLTLGLIAVVVVLGLLAVRQRFGPAFQQLRTEREQAGLLADGNANLEAGRLDEAESSYRLLLAQVPDHADALKGLEQVEAKREIARLCEEAEQLYQGGQLAEARAKFVDLSISAPGTCNASLRIEEISRRLQREDLLAQAEAHYAEDRCGEAVPIYRQLQELDVSYERELIESHLFDCYMRLGRGLVQADPPAAEAVPQALEYFTLALQLRPRDPDATAEQRLTSLFVAGQQAYEVGQYGEAAIRLGTVYDARPGYLGAVLVGLLFDTYIRAGDAARDAGDLYLAWEQYRKASELPVEDNTLATGRMAAIQPYMTPTPTPTPTLTPTPIPTATPYIPPTPVPSGTPPAPLANYRNQIIFRADKEGQSGFWVMNPDGTNRRYLGNSPTVQQEQQALWDRERFSPDGRYRAYVIKGESDKSPQIYIQALERDQYGNLPTKQLTHLSKTTYDPVWAPDGSRIAFVSQDAGSDDIWVMNPDGTNLWNYTLNKWEWDKHPSWSPDSGKIVFWSNREGTKQIYVIDADGRNLKKISNTTWDEYDPVWVK